MTLVGVSLIRQGSGKGRPFFLVTKGKHKQVSNAKGLQLKKKYGMTQLQGALGVSIGYKGFVDSKEFS